VARAKAPYGGAVDAIVDVKFEIGLVSRQAAFRTTFASGAEVVHTFDAPTGAFVIPPFGGGTFDVAALLDANDAYRRWLGAVRRELRPVVAPSTPYELRVQSGPDEERLRVKLGGDTVADATRIAPGRVRFKAHRGATTTIDGAELWSLALFRFYVRSARPV
jgi:hypothetical protein